MAKLHIRNNFNFILLHSIVVLIFCVQLYFTLGAEMSCNSGHTNPSKVCLMGAVFEVIKPCDIKMCLKKCKKIKQCKSINHKRKTMECELNSAIINTEYSLTSNEDCTYIDIKSFVEDLSVCDQLNCSEKEKCVELKSGKAVCMIKGCGAVPYLHNASPNSTKASVGTYIEYQQIPSMDTHKIRTVCRSTGKWDRFTGLEPVNLTGTETKSSSIWNNKYPGLAIDDNVYTYFHSGKEAASFPYWNIIFNRTVDVMKVAVQKRLLFKNDYLRFRNVTVYVGNNTGDFLKCNTFGEPDKTSFVEFQCKDHMSIPGDTIKIVHRGPIDLDNGRFLILKEVKIYGF